jgi:aminoglycoside phosphotransferase (APT) family kinase protein
MPISSDFNLDSLQKHLDKNLEGFGQILECKKFGDGQSNPTYLLSSSDRKSVLRKKPVGQLLKSAHAVEREYQVMTALSETSIPVPKTRLLCEDETVIGTAFFIMEYIEGRIFWNPALPDIDTVQRQGIFKQMAKLLSDLHKVDVQKVGLSSFGKPGNYYARQLDRWVRQYHMSETGKISAMDKLIGWLQKNLVEDDQRSCLVHGDFRLDNMIFDFKHPRIIALLDWELSTLGHPYADLAYQCMQLRMPDNKLLPGLGSCNRKQLGIPSEEEYVDLYCQFSGISSIPHWDFYIAFSFFRFAAILQGVKKRAIDGNASSNRAYELGELVDPMAQMALESVR